MKRIAAPMVGGLITSAFLTLEIIPVISTYWRQEQLLWERLEPLDTRSGLVLAGSVILALVAVALVYVDLAAGWSTGALVLSAVCVVGGAVFYASQRRPARRLVWPDVVEQPAGA
jgi:Cu(I)/Ag(I) efflux system membrane protein CusA/SilA